MNLLYLKDRDHFTPFASISKLLFTVATGVSCHLLSFIYVTSVYLDSPLRHASVPWLQTRRGNCEVSREDPGILSKEVIQEAIF